MSRWGKPTKNKKRIDPRYFMDEKQELIREEYDIGFDPEEAGMAAGAEDELAQAARVSAIMLPAAKKVSEFLSAPDIPMHGSSAKLAKKYVDALQRFLTPEMIVKISRDARGAGTQGTDEQGLSENVGGSMEESEVVQSARAAGYDLAADALMALGTLSTADRILLKQIDQLVFKGKLGPQLFGGDGIMRTISDSVSSVSAKDKTYAEEDTVKNQPAPGPGKMMVGR